MESNAVIQQQPPPFEAVPAPEHELVSVLEPEPAPEQEEEREPSPEPEEGTGSVQEQEQEQETDEEAAPAPESVQEQEEEREPSPETDVEGAQTQEPEPEEGTGSEQEQEMDEEAAQAPEPVPENLPCQDLLDDARRRDFINTCVPLYEASIKVDWGAAESIFLNNTGVLPDNRDLVRYSITEHCDTALHVAASAQRNTKSTRFVRRLVDMMSLQDLQLQNRNGNTALCLAAAAGNLEIAEIMVGQNPELLAIPNRNQLSPLYIAALYRNRDMVYYLYDQDPLLNVRGWTPTQKGWLYMKCIEVDLFDMALRIFRDHPDIPYRENELTVFGVLAQKSSAFDEIKSHGIRRIFNSMICCEVRPAAEEGKAMELLEAIWASIEERPKAEIDAILRGPQVMVDGEPTQPARPTHPSRVLFVAAEMGNTNFVVKLIRKYPDLIWKKNDNNQSIFHIAVSHRRESIYNLLYEIGSTKAFITVLKDREGNNMLHLVGKKAEKNQPQDVSGVAFQLQRELLWFKEVESMLPPDYKDKKNKAGQTPHELFTETHKVLVSDAEKWMKGTASKCMVVAALIATIVFGVAYTIPGGYNQKDGFPMFLSEVPFIVFVAFDAISLILSSTSILMFLSILTSRYAQKDFIEPLPKKLMVGLATLFLSIVTMMIAFSVSFFVLYRHKFIPIAIVISTLALIPIIAYAKLQYPLLADVFRSTFASRYLFKPKKRILYYQDPML